jgi:choline-sulfatase
VLTALRDSGLAERTTVLFTADHGEMLGERGLWYKMSFFEQSARVPLIVRRPGGSGTRVREPVSLIDVAPTLLSLAGMAADSGLALDGIDLAGVVRGDGPVPEHPVISEYHAEGVQASSAMVRHGDHKLIVSLEDPDLLYDLQDDPRELRDLVAGGEHDALVAALRGMLGARLDLGDIDHRVRISQLERRLVSRALRQGRYTSWDYQPPVDAAMQYVRNREDLYELQRRARLDEPGTELN